MPSVASEQIPRRFAPRDDRAGGSGLAHAGRPGRVPRELLAHFVRLLGLECQRALPMRDGSRDVALPFGEIAQMLLDRRVVGFAAMSFEQVHLRRLELPHPEINPPERVQIGAVARLAAHGLLEQDLGLFQILAPVSPHVAEVILSGGVVGPHFQELGKDPLRFRGISRALEA